MVAGFVNHFRCCLPSLSMTNWKLFHVSFGTTAIGVGFAYGLSVAIGFPVPFTVPVESMAGVMVLTVWLIQLWRPVLLFNEALQQDLRHQVWVFIALVAMNFVYPLYLFAFTSIQPNQQSIFTFALPIIKLAFKNYFSRKMHQLDDCKPASIVFNADLFNALYVTNCLQSSQSLVNTLLVLGVDVAQLAVSMYDVHTVMREIRSFVRLDHFDGSLLDLCVMAADPSDAVNELIKPMPTSRMLSSTIHPIDRQADDRDEKAAHSGSALTAKYLTLIPVNDRARLVSKIAMVLYLAEFILLIEFVEVMIPVIYGASCPHTFDRCRHD